MALRKNAALVALAFLLLASPVLTLAATPTCPDLARTLARGAKGADVSALQQFFVSQGLLASDSVTGYFGALTEAAVQKFQTAQGIVSSGTPASTGYGLVGAKTRAAIGLVCAHANASASANASGSTLAHDDTASTAANNSSPVLATGPAGIITNALAASFGFDEGSGSTITDAVGGEQGTLVNNPAWVAGKLGTALDFNGTSQTARVSAPKIQGLNSLTISVWFYARSNGGGTENGLRILSKKDTPLVPGEIAIPNRFALQLNNDNSLRFNVGYDGGIGSYLTAPNSVSLNAWHQATVTYTYGNIATVPAIFIDGVPQPVTTQATPVGNPVEDDSNLYIGARSNDAKYWDGSIDQLRIYDRVLSAAEIKDLYRHDSGAGNPPNIIVIMSDDQNDTGSLDVMKNVQQLLVNQGTHFTNSFVNFSLCCPSRASFLTGQAAHNTGIIGNAPNGHGGYGVFIAQEGNTLPVWLQKVGYDTAVIGKYLNGYGDGITNTTTHIPPGWNTVDLLPDSLGTYNYYNYSLNINGTLQPHSAIPTEYQTDVLAQKAVDYIASRQSSGQPFFLWLTPMAPHDGGGHTDDDPFGTNAPVPPPRYAGLYDSAPLPQPPNFNEADVSDKPIFVQNRPLLDASAIATTTNNYRRKLETVLGVDDMVARVVSELQKEGKLDNTVIIYTSDNGWANGQHRLISGKRNVYDEIIRVPLVMRGPGIPAGQTRSQLVNNLDVTATIEDIAHVTPGHEPDGRSLVSILNDPNASWRTDLLVEGGDGNAPWPTVINGKLYEGDTLGYFFAVRTPKYLYVEHNAPDARYIIPPGFGLEREFYDLSNDPYELQSKPNDAAYAPIVSTLANILNTLRYCTGPNCFINAQDKEKTPAPTATLTQSSDTTTSDGTTGQPFTVTWTSTNATSCTLQKTPPTGATGYFFTNANGTCGGSATFVDPGLSGSCVAKPGLIGVHHWFLDCTGPGGTVHKDVNHTVASSSNSTAPTASLTQSTDTTTSDGTTGQSFTITWSSTDATSCTLQKTRPDGFLTNPWESTTSGTRTATLIMIGQFHWQIDCTGPGGMVHQDMYHTVVSSAPTATLTQSSDTTTSDGTTGQPFTVTWTSTNATSCTLQKTPPTGATGYFFTNANGTCGGSATFVDPGLSGSCVAKPGLIGVHHWFLDCTGPGGTVHKDVNHTVVSGTAASASSMYANLASILSAIQAILEKMRGQ